MKSTIKIAALLLATIAITAALGWVYAINALQNWIDQYVAVSMLSTKPIAPASATRCKGKAIVPKAMTLVIKESVPNYAGMTLRQLKDAARGTGIKNWSRLTKGALIAALVVRA